MKPCTRSGSYQIVEVAFFGSFKLERIERLAEYMTEHGVQLTVHDITGHRNPIYLFRQILQLPRNNILMTHESLMVPFVFLLTHFIGYRYVYIQNGVLWHNWANSLPMQRRIRTFVYQRILKGACSVICNSEYLRNELRRFFPLAGNKYISIHNAVDLPQSLPPEEMFDFEAGAQHFVTITNFEYPQKYGGLNYLLQALDRSLSPKPVLHVLSKVLTDSARENLIGFQRETNELQSKVDVRFYINEDIRRFLNREISFLYCSLPGGDSFPRAVVEVLSLGIPSLIVATNGCAEAIYNDEMALVVPLDDRQIEQGINKLMSSSEERLKMMRSAPRNIRSQVSWERMAREYAHVLLFC